MTSCLEICMSSDISRHPFDNEPLGKERLTIRDTNRGPDANELALSPDTPTSIPFCTCLRSSYPTNADDLGDNGRSVTYHQRKMWEVWVCGKTWF